MLEGFDLAGYFADIDVLELEHDSADTVPCRIRVGLRRTVELALNPSWFRLYCSCSCGGELKTLCGEELSLEERDGILTFDLYRFLKERGFPVGPSRSFYKSAVSFCLRCLDGIFYKEFPGGFRRELSMAELCEKIGTGIYFSPCGSGKHLPVLVCPKEGNTVLCGQTVHRAEYYGHVGWVLNTLLSEEKQEFTADAFFARERENFRGCGAMLILTMVTDRAKYTVGSVPERAIHSGSFQVKTTLRVEWNGKEYIMEGSGEQSLQEESLLMLLLQLMRQVECGTLDGYVAKCRMLGRKLPPVWLPEPDERETETINR